LPATRHGCSDQRQHCQHRFIPGARVDVYVTEGQPAMQVFTCPPRPSRPPLSRGTQCRDDRQRSYCQHQLAVQLTSVPNSSKMITPQTDSMENFDAGRLQGALVDRVEMRAGATTRLMSMYYRSTASTSPGRAWIKHKYHARFLRSLPRRLAARSTDNLCHPIPRLHMDSPISRSPAHPFNYAVSLAGPPPTTWQLPDQVLAHGTL